MPNPPDSAQIDAEVRNAAILQGALTFGPVLFLAVTAGLPLEPPTEIAPDAQQTIEMFSAVNAFTALGCVAAAMILPKMVGQQSGAQDLSVLARLRNEMILRMALLEGAALFGVVVIFLAKSWGVLAEQPLIWANAAGLVVMVLISAATFPTRGRLEKALRDGTDGL